MAEYLQATANYQRSDAFNPNSGLIISEISEHTVKAAFRKFGEPVRVRVPWGNKKFWNILASMETIGIDETIRWEDNRLLHQEIIVEDDPEDAERYWTIRARCFFTFFGPPLNEPEPGIDIRVKALVVLR